MKEPSMQRSLSYLFQQDKPQQVRLQETSQQTHAGHGTGRTWCCCCWWWKRAVLEWGPTQCCAAWARWEAGTAAAEARPGHAWLPACCPAPLLNCWYAIGGADCAEKDKGCSSAHSAHVVRVSELTSYTRGKPTTTEAEHTQSLQLWTAYIVQTLVLWSQVI